MRKIVLSLAAAGAAFIAVPAAAQPYPPPQPAPYGHGSGYGFHGNWGEFRSLQMRIDNVRRQIDRLDGRDSIRGRTADRLMDEANRIDRRLRERARSGLDPREAGEIRYRIQRLEQQVQWAAHGRWDRLGDRDRDRY